MLILLTFISFDTLYYNKKTVMLVGESARNGDGNAFKSSAFGPMMSCEIVPYNLIFDPCFVF